MLSRAQPDPLDKTPNPVQPLRVNILGVGVHAISIPQAVELIDRAIASRQRGYVCVTGVHGIMEAQHDAALCQILNRSFITTPDGMPTVWIGRLTGHSAMRRVYGPELMEEVCRLSVEKGYRHFLFGGKPGVADELARALAGKIPGLNIVGTFTPPFRPLNTVEESEFLAKVAQARPHILWVGISTPKQEKFMAEYLGKLDTTLMIGVGAAFDIHTGHIKDAPAWMKKAGLQWLHRVAQEPGRLTKRYLQNNPRFLYRAALQLLGVRRYVPPDFESLSAGTD